MSGPPHPPSVQASLRTAPPSRAERWSSNLSVWRAWREQKAFFYSCLVMRPRSINASTPAFVSSSGCCASPGGPGQPVDPLASSPARGRTTGSDRPVRLVAITGSISRARSGVPWERGGPRLAPPAGAVRLNAKAGLITLWLGPGNRTVLSVQKPWFDGYFYTEAGGQDPRGGPLAPLRGVQRLALPRTCSGRPSRRRRPQPASCFHP